MNKVQVAGVNMVKFAKPGQQNSYRQMASEAIRGAVAEAGIAPELIGQAYGSYVYGDSTCAQHDGVVVISFHGRAGGME